MPSGPTEPLTLAMDCPEDVFFGPGEKPLPPPS